MACQKKDESFRLCVKVSNCSYSYKCHFELI